MRFACFVRLWLLLLLGGYFCVCVCGRGVCGVPALCLRCACAVPALCLREAKSRQFWTPFPPMAQGDRSNYCVPRQRAAQIPAPSKNSDNEIMINKLYFPLKLPDDCLNGQFLRRWCGVSGSCGWRGLCGTVLCTRAQPGPPPSTACHGHRPRPKCPSSFWMPVIGPSRSPQACLSVTYLFVHPDKTPGWLRWSYTVSPIRWGIQAVVMSGLDVVFALTGPFFQQAEALDLFYAAGLGSESAPFCLLVLTAWWLGCTLAVALVFQLRFRTSILKRAAILPDISPEPATCPAEDGAPRSPAPLRSPSSRQLDAMFSVHSVHSFRGGAPRAAPGDAEDPLQRLRARRDARTQAGARDAGSELRRRFDAVARGGAMDGSGFARFMREGLGHALPWPTAERLFRGLDVCGRGAVEFKELQRWVYVREHLSAAATAQVCVCCKPCRFYFLLSACIWTVSSRCEVFVLQSHCATFFCFHVVCFFFCFYVV